jgi:hypothetical protein
MGDRGKDGLLEAHRTAPSLNAAPSSYPEDTDIRRAPLPRSFPLNETD